MPTIHLLIKGKVQGVFYRVSAKKIAEKYGITGWIRNMESGDVEATVTGTEEQVTQFRTWCHMGPKNATVINVFENKLEEILFKSFTIK